MSLPRAITTTGVSVSVSYLMNTNGLPWTSLATSVTGVATYTVEQAIVPITDAGLPGIPAAADWLPIADPAMVGATANQQSNYAFLPTHIRLNQTAGAGSVRLTILQTGAAGN